MGIHNSSSLWRVGAFFLGSIALLPVLMAERPVSVCAVQSNLNRYRGKFIAVRAMLLGGRHGWILQDGPGEEPCEEVRKQGHMWPPAIAIVQWREGSDIEDGPATFESNAEQIAHALSEARKLVDSDRTLAISAIFVGELRSRKGIQIVRTKDGWYMGNAYAQSGQYPALLVLKTVRDVKVVKQNAEGR